MSLKAAIYFSPKARAEAGGIYAVIYCRTATEGQGEPSALDRQEAACRAHAARDGKVVASVYREVAGGLGTDRPQLAALREGIASGLVDTVLVTALDRLSRSWQETRRLLGEWEAAGVSVVAVEEGA